jgi:hypothetical protein
MLLVLVLASTVALAVAPTASAASGSISGRVTDTQGQPVPGVDVEVITYDNSYCAAQLRTDSDGKYVASGLAAGTYQVRFYLFGWVTTFYKDAPWPNPATPVVLADGEDLVGIDATLARGAEVRGTITDSNGQPVPWAGAEVYSPTSDTGCYCSMPLPDGSYLVPGLPAGTYVVSFWAPDYCVEWYDDAGSMRQGQVITLSEGQVLSGIDAQLTRGAEISGTVVDATGTPVVGATVQVWFHDPDGFGTYVVSSQVTDAHGTYRAATLRSGDYTVGFSSPGYTTTWYRNAFTFDTARVVHVARDEVVSGIDCTLLPLPSISGHVWETNRSPARAFVEIYVLDPSGAWSLWQRVTTLDGTYRLDGLEPGVCKIGFRRLDYLGPANFYRGARSLSDATVIRVGPGEQLTGVDGQVPAGLSPKKS